jgi:hypothetical protein
MASEPMAAHHATPCMAPVDSAVGTETSGAGVLWEKSQVTLKASLSSPGETSREGAAHELSCLVL